MAGTSQMLGIVERTTLTYRLVLSCLALSFLVFSSGWNDLAYFLESWLIVFSLVYPLDPKCMGSL